mmetsp:Transcript_16417/g.34489  ORF Transcript_16417/g.34489 Transcript_16417/m.34489 type:complete len:221 (+) Transcript_16417:110-772(+)
MGGRPPSRRIQWRGILYHHCNRNDLNHRCPRDHPNGTSTFHISGVRSESEGGGVASLDSSEVGGAQGPDRGQCRHCGGCHPTGSWSSTSGDNSSGGGSLEQRQEQKAGGNHSERRRRRQRQRQRQKHQPQSRKTSESFRTGPHVHGSRSFIGKAATGGAIEIVATRNHEGEDQSVFGSFGDTCGVFFDKRRDWRDHRKILFFRRQRPSPLGNHNQLRRQS